MRIINPATEEVITEVAEDSAQTLQTKFNKLHAAQPAWAAKPLAERITCIQRFADLLAEESAAAFVDARTETVALKRTASGTTEVVPMPVTVM